jgi:hypothetical protein
MTKLAHAILCQLIAAPIAVLIPAAVVTCRICSDPRVMRWLEQQK